MRISDQFGLNLSQYELDFVDIDPSVDLRLFVDPYFLAHRTDAWSLRATHTIRHFFQHFIELVRSGQLDDARALFQHLNEPNETCLGMSSGRPQGRGVGQGDADRLFESLVGSKAVRTGLIEDLEDCRVFVQGIDKDKTSDMATNIIRRHLIEYTQEQCRFHDIPLRAAAPSGFVWDTRTASWDNYLTDMLLVDDRVVLLVPKAIVSYSKRYTAKTYYQHFVLSFLQHEHLRLNTALVKRKRLRNGTEKTYVAKKDVHNAEKAANDINKDYLVNFTTKHPSVFDDFKSQLADADGSIPDHELAAAEKNAIIDHIIQKLRDLEPGTENATAYHRLAVGILELVFYPELFAPVIEQKLHDGRKRIDIVFEKNARDGFFFDLDTRHRTPAPWVLAECKNYGRELGNPDLDQLAGRFSNTRGRFGMLLARSVEDMDLLLKRCTDTFRDDRGVIIPLLDDDLVTLLEGCRQSDSRFGQEFLTERFRRIAFG